MPTTATNSNTFTTTTSSHAGLPERTLRLLALIDKTSVGGEEV